MDTSFEKVKSNEVLAYVSTRLFGVYDSNGNISTVHRTKNKATIVKNRLVKHTGDNDYFVDEVIVH